MAYQGQKDTAYGVLGLTAANKISSPALLGTGINFNQIGDGTCANADYTNLSGTAGNLQQQINNLVAGGTAFEATATATVDVTISNPGTDTFDTVVLTVGQTLQLLPLASGGAQINAAEGGLYTFNGSGVALTRLSTMSAWDQIVGSRVYVNAGGVTYGGTVWANTNTPGGTIDVTNITYAQIQQNYVNGDNIIITGNEIATSLTPEFTSVATTAVADFQSAGTPGASLTQTAPVLTGDRIVTYPDANSNSVQPTTDTADNVVGWIDNNGVQQLKVVIDQLLTGFTPTAGTVTAADSILTALQKFAVSFGVFSVIHQSASYQFLVGDGTVIMDADAQTGTLPDATTVSPNVVYTFKLGVGATTGTLAVLSGQSLDDVVNGTFLVSGASNSVSAISDGTSWYTV